MTSMRFNRSGNVKLKAAVERMAKAAEHFKKINEKYKVKSVQKNVAPIERKKISKPKAGFTNKRIKLKTDFIEHLDTAVQRELETPKYKDKFEYETIIRTVALLEFRRLALKNNFDLRNEIYPITDTASGIRGDGFLEFLDSFVEYCDE